MNIKGSTAIFVANALRVAAEQYKIDAEVIRATALAHSGIDRLLSLAQKFDDQSDQAVAIAEQLENE